MKNKVFIIFLMSFFCGTVYAQNSISDINVGDMFKINKVQSNTYQHINFPKDNFIRKKGGLPNYTGVVGKNVEITSIKKKKDGSLLATIKLTSGKPFFNSHKYIQVNIEKAISEKELIKI